jgi:fatty acid synthase subunit beta
MVAGMTPTTVKAGFVSAILDAGYHVELAGGGHYSPNALRSKVAEIQAKIPAGVGLTLNSLYINPRQFNFQLPLWQELRRDGVPVEGFCVAAGIPTTEKAVEIIDGLKAAGIKHVAFKPGSVDGIRQVVNIAAANPDFPIVLQWTGGRAGGHHSFEDFHQPVLATYRSIRQQPNIVLVAGSGFGSAEDVWPYLTGEWSSNHFDVQPMPFDGFLFASRVMVAKEAHTSSSVKDLIVGASGVGDEQWEGTYIKPTGGVLTVRSELGEPIHKVATRGVRLWKEFDDSVFNLPKEKRAAWLAERRDEVISKLNKDFAKPWFGWKKDGSVAKELDDMTYEETVLRMVRLMFVAHEKRWIDQSLRNLTGDWLRRVEERFAGVNGTGNKPSLLQSYTSLDDPAPFVESFFKTYPLATEQLLAAEDAAYFLAIAQRPGQKPVPFIPVLDKSFEVWFKKVGCYIFEAICMILTRVAIFHNHRTLSGQPKILKPCLIKILNAFVFFKVLSQLRDRPPKTSQSKTFSAISIPLLFPSFLNGSIPVTNLPSRLSNTLPPSPPFLPPSMASSEFRGPMTLSTSSVPNFHVLMLGLRLSAAQS